MNLVPKSTGHFRSFDGTRIYYEVRGQGAPVVLNYGIGCLINHWRPQIKYFSERNQVITWDYRAHHKSDIPENRAHLNMDAMAQDLNALLDHLELPRASLWGHSFGVQMLVRFYDLFPNRAHSMVFVNGFVQNPLQGMFGSPDLTESFFKLFKSGYEILPETLGFLWRAGIQNPLAIHLSALAGGFNLKLTSLKDVEIYARGIASMDLNAFLQLFESMLHYDGKSVLERVQIPVIIIGGKQDSVTPQKHQEEMHHLIKGSDFFMVPYGSHCTQLDMPELVNLKIEQFLKAHTK
ncbi:MAG TPA: alpha/beta hydrolase [Bdellovibrionales bacterium]|nr:alpha/beta hydrolase [Bdellovibrionales bacterium]